MTFTGEPLDGIVEPPKETADFTFNHTMLRVKDPAVSLHFYSKILGMTALRKLDFPEMNFSLYFLAKLRDGETISEDEAERTVQTFSREGVLELTHNWGTENDVAFAYHDSNAQPQGFGHICISVPDLDKAIAWFDDNGVEFIKRLEDGKMNHIAFIKDPDGYWIEIIQADRTV